MSNLRFCRNSDSIAIIIEVVSEGHSREKVIEKQEKKLSRTDEKHEKELRRMNKELRRMN